MKWKGYITLNPPHDANETQKPFLYLVGNTEATRLFPGTVHVEESVCVAFPY